MTEQQPTSGQHNGGTEAESSIYIQPRDAGAGVTIVDPIERHHYDLETPTPVELESASPAALAYPVDTAVSFTTTQLTLPAVVAVYIRNSDQQMVAEAEHQADETVPEGQYSLEIPAPIKLYLRVESQVTVTADVDRTAIDFGSPTQVVLGARSYHDNPADTVVTTGDPEDIMAAVSTLGSALKTTAPERSYPTLRGHPPLIEQGDQLAIPDGVTSPETGVRIEVPRALEYIYPAASLAYYLGATLEPGDEPRLVTETGFTHSLAPPGQEYETEVERVLKQVFFLDCITRTEGLYEIDLHERTAIEPILDWDPATVYDQPLAKQLESYLAVPFEEVSTYVPTWKLATHVEAAPGSVETVPFLVDDLAVIRTPDTRSSVRTDELQEATAEFMRDGDFVRSTSDASPTEQSVVHPGTTNTLEQAWVGDGAPAGASKTIVDAYQNRLERTPTTDDIDITVVVNDPRMLDERELVDDVYGSRSDLPFEVTVHEQLTTDRLEILLGADIDFFHYIGHVDQEGISCTDGKLDVRRVDAANVEAFFLNACQSYDQGLAFIEQGAIGGIATYNDIPNNGAVRVGATMARLLNRGFPLRSALDIAKDESVVGSQYVIVGDGGFSITQAESGLNILLEIERTTECFDVTAHTYPTGQRDIGSEMMPFVEGNDEYYLSASEQMEFALSREQLMDVLALEEMPVRVDGELRWSSDVVSQGL